MQRIKVEYNLNSIKDIKDFVSAASKCENEVVVKSGKFTVDGKSILGLLSLDLSKTVVVEVDVKDAVRLSQYYKAEQ